MKQKIKADVGANVDIKIDQSTKEEIYIKEDQSQFLLLPIEQINTANADGCQTKYLLTSTLPN